MASLAKNSGKTGLEPKALLTVRTPFLICVHSANSRIGLRETAPDKAPQDKNVHLGLFDGFD